MNKKKFLSIQLALQTFQKTKARSFLTVFGITIGIAMVIIVLSAGRGVKALILNEVSSFGDDWINIEVKMPSASKNSQENATGLARGVIITTLVREDMEKITRLKNIDKAYAGITTQVVISHDQEKERPTIFGVTADYYGIDKTEIVNGRFFSDQEDLSWNDLKLQYQSVFMKESDDHLGIGPFQNISDLHRFGLSLGEKIGSPQVYFHSVFDYNQMVEQVFDIAGFKKSLLAGHMIETNKNKGTNSSFFGRIFKDS